MNSKKVMNFLYDKSIGDVLKRIPKAQYWLDTQIMTDMASMMPHDTGTFINLVRMKSSALAGTGRVVVYSGPSGRYLYHGKKMIDPLTGKGPRRIPIGGGEYIFRYRYGAKLVPSAQDLHYSNPEARPYWDEVAFEIYGKAWREGVKKILDGR